MLPLKTEHARTVLQGHRTALDMRQRRLLILCDGQRDVAALSALLGPDTPGRVAALIEAGYLQAMSGAPPGVVPVAVSMAPPPAVAPARRRSLVAARIYLIGILELQRHPEAASWLRALQQARAEADLVSAMRHAIAALPGLTSAGYAARVRERLLEVIPAEYATSLDATSGADSG